MCDYLDYTDLRRALTFSRSTLSSSTSPCSLCLVFSRLEHLACVASTASSASCSRADSFFLKHTLVTPMSDGRECECRVLHHLQEDAMLLRPFGTNLKNGLFKRKKDSEMGLELD